MSVQYIKSKACPAFLFCEMVFAPVVHVLKKQLVAVAVWTTSLPLAVCQERERYLTGFRVEGPFIGALIVGTLLLLLWLIRKYLVRLILTSIVAMTLGGVGYLIGSMFVHKLAVPLALGFFILGIAVSLKMPKRGAYRNAKG